MQTQNTPDPGIEIVGRRIVGLRSMSTAELAAEGWPPHQSVPAIILDDGTVLYPSRDEEGNGPGAVFGMSSRGQGFQVLAPRRR
jgi:hypothetical protein